MSSNLEKFGLALSGGGVRASAYHAGVLLYLAERNILEKVTHISSVSGGTLFTGLVFYFSDFIWVTSDSYQKKVFAGIRHALTSFSLQKDFILRSAHPLNWRLFFTRANVLAQSIKELWNIKGKLGELPTTPSWSINGTTSETGRRFRFKNCRLGDYELGYADAPDFELASAMAISAAFPIGIGPLSVSTKNYSWYKRENWDAEEETVYTPPHDTIHLYDGGVYDNLGIEPIFDVGRQVLKESSNVDCLILSDAGAPYARRKIPNPLNPCRVTRLLDLTTDQTRALRIRSFINYLQQDPLRGLYCQLGMAPLRLPKICNHIDDEHVKKIQNEEWLSDQDTNYALNYKTSLKKMSISDFDLIARHGYESAKSAALFFWT